MPKAITGKFVWFEHNSNDAKKAQSFYKDTLGWKVEPTKVGDETYDMINTGDVSIGGYMPLSGDSPRWIGYVSVDDVDKAAAAAKANGGKIVEPPNDVPEVGCMARITDPQGAEISIYKGTSAESDDVKNVPPGRFFWNELHTTDPEKALAFYEKVVGFTHRVMDMGEGGKYYIIGKDGVDRGGVTHWLEQGKRPYWLPYIHVENADEVAERARKAKGTVTFGPENIPNVGRFAILQDPTGAAVAVMKPTPM